MTFDPTKNRIPMGLLTQDEQNILLSSKHGLQRYFEKFCEWRDVDSPIWYVMGIYRAKPAPVVKSTWVCVHSYDTGRPFPAREYVSLEDAKDDPYAGIVGIIRLDLIDGKLSVEVEQ